MNTTEPNQPSKFFDFASFICNLNRIHSESNFKQTNQAKYNKLEPIEVIVLSCIADDLSEMQIAEKLKVKPSMVKIYRRNIEHKLSVRSETQLFKFALTFNLI